MKMRNLFDELMQGLEEMGEHRKGKSTLHQYEMEAVASGRQVDQEQSGQAEKLGAVKIKAECPGSIAD